MVHLKGKLKFKTSYTLYKRKDDIANLQLFKRQIVNYCTLVSDNVSYIFLNNVLLCGIYMHIYIYILAFTHLFENFLNYML